MAEQLSYSEMRSFLEEQADRFNNPSFIESDPILVPREYEKKEDIEVAAFLTATIAWGKRPIIIRNAHRLMTFMDHAPYDFIMNHGSNDLKSFQSFTHRTFNGIDCCYFLESLQNIYVNHGGLEAVFSKKVEEGQTLKEALPYFRQIFFEKPFPSRVGKHVANIEKGSSAKRLFMFLRWMVRNDHKGVDFGLWRNISPASLFLPLDVHSGNVSRELGILKRKSNDWKAVEEVTSILRQMDPMDPVKYDFALFGLGVFEGFGREK